MYSANSWAIVSADAVSLFLTGLCVIRLHHGCLRDARKNLVFINRLKLIITVSHVRWSPPGTRVALNAG